MERFLLCGNKCVLRFLYSLSYSVKCVCLCWVQSKGMWCTFFKHHQIHMEKASWKTHKENNHLSVESWEVEIVACRSVDRGAAVELCCSAEAELEEERSCEDKTEEDTAAVSLWVGGEACCGEAAVMAPWQASKCLVMSGVGRKIDLGLLTARYQIRN